MIGSVKWGCNVSLKILLHCQVKQITIIGKFHVKHVSPLHVAEQDVATS